MKALSCLSVVLLCALISFPITAEAFSRRPHSSEVEQTRSAPLATNSETPTTVPQQVPEPSTYMLLGIGIGLFALYSLKDQFRRQRDRD